MWHIVTFQISKGGVTRQKCVRCGLLLSLNDVPHNFPKSLNGSGFFWVQIWLYNTLLRCLHRTMWGGSGLSRISGRPSLKRRCSARFPNSFPSTSCSTSSPSHHRRAPAPQRRGSTASSPRSGTGLFTLQARVGPPCWTVMFSRASD